MDNEAVNECLRALAHEQRRELLRTLRDTDEIGLSEFAAGRERGGSQPVEGELHHQHVPRLADAGLVEYDPAGKIVTRGDRFGDVVSLLDVVDAMPDSMG